MVTELGPRIGEIDVDHSEAMPRFKQLREEVIEIKGEEAYRAYAGIKRLPPRHRADRMVFLDREVGARLLGRQLKEEVALPAADLEVGRGAELKRFEGREQLGVGEDEGIGPLLLPASHLAAFPSFKMASA